MNCNPRFFFFNSHRKFIFFCWIVSHFIFLPSHVWLISGHHHGRILGGGVNLRSVSSQDADKMVILGSFIPRNYFTFYWNNIVFGIKLQLRSWSIKRYYSFRPIASYRDARGEDTNAHTHAHLFLLKWSVTLSEIACRLPGFQRDKDRITIIGKSIGVSSPGNIYVHVLCHICVPTFSWQNKAIKVCPKYLLISYQNWSSQHWRQINVAQSKSNDVHNYPGYEYDSGRVSTICMVI